MAIVRGIRFPAPTFREYLHGLTGNILHGAQGVYDKAAVREVQVESSGETEVPCTAKVTISA